MDTNGPGWLGNIGGDIKEGSGASGGTSVKEANAPKPGSKGTWFHSIICKCGCGGAGLDLDYPTTGKK